MMLGWIIALVAAWFGYTNAGVLGAVGAFVLAAIILAVIESVFGLTVFGIASLFGGKGKR